MYFYSSGVAAAFARYFALGVQDRIARTEERLRYYTLTGKTLPSNSKMGQILALRLASDDEFISLVERKIKEQLLPNEIKKVVINWIADYYRI
nr:DUF6526 family protein [Pedobacter sp. ASV28]